MSDQHLGDVQEDWLTMRSTAKCSCGWESEDFASQLEATLALTHHYNEMYLEDRYGPSL